jgi:hypothetical protein
LSLNDRITPQCKPTPYNCQKLPYDDPPHSGAPSPSSIKGRKVGGIVAAEYTLCALRRGLRELP